MKSKIIFAAMILFILASVSFASAADNQTDIMTADSTDEVLEAPDDGSFAALKGEIESNPQNYKLTRNYTHSDNDGLEIIKIENENYVLDGDGHSIDANSSVKFFDITAQNVTIKNIIFKNGFGSTGSVTFLKAGTMDNCTFINCSSTTGMGGAYFHENGNVLNSHFYNNKANGPSGSALFIKEGTVTDCEFENNTAQEGGAIFATEDVTVDGCTFTENAAINGCGGAIYSNSSVKVKNSRFKNNKASKEGGAIMALGWTDIDGSNFTQNNAQSGGGIYFSGVLNLNNTNFSDNNATDTTNNISMFGSSVIFGNASAEELGPFKIVEMELISQSANIVYGQKFMATFNVTSQSNPVSGILEATIGGVKYYGTVLNGVGTLEINKPDAGSYTTNVTFIGDATYNNPFKPVSFSVSQRNITLNITNITNTDFGDITKITAQVSGFGITVSQGAVTFTVNGTEFTAIVNNSTATVSIPNLKPGNYTGTAKYDGGNNYAKPSKDFTFKISQKDVEINVTDITGTTYGDTLIITANVTCADETIYEGNVIVTINGKQYSAGVKYGVAAVEIKGLNVGEYIAAVSYDGGYMYSKPSSNCTFTIDPRNVTLQVNYENITEGKTATITVNVIADNYTVNESNITLTINDTAYTKPVKNGTATFTIYGLNIGTHHAEIIFNGGNNFNSPSESIELEVSKKILSLIITNITGTAYGEVTKINVSVTGDNIIINEGGVRLTINNLNYTQLVTNGTATIEVPNLQPGTYMGSVTYIGNSNYDNPTQPIKFTIEPCIVNLAVANITGTTYGDILKITINVTSEMETIYEGKITVIVNNREYTTDVNYGTATVEIEGLDIGDYTAEISYEGGDKYSKPSINENFPIDTREVDLEILCENITYGDTAEITVNLLAGDYTINEGALLIEVNGATYYLPVKNSTATLKVSNLKVGTYTVGSIFDGGRNYDTGYESVTLNVSQMTVSLNVTEYDATYGEPGILVIKVNGEREVNEGTVSAKVAGLVYTSEVKDGIAVIIVPYLNAGTYTGNVTFEADDNYNKPTESYEFTVEKATPKFEVKYDVNITYGDVMVITANITSMKKAVETGSVYVTLAGKSYRGYVENGIAVIEIPNLDANLYTGNVTYSGTNNYNSTTEAILFNVARADVEISDINITGAVYGDIIEITANVSNSNGGLNLGILSILINGRYYTAKVENGMATIYIPELDAGAYDSTLIFDGGNNYNNAEKQVTFEVAKKTVSIMAEYANITYSETATVTVYVTSGIEGINVGNITAILNGNNFTAPVQNGIATLSFADLNVGIYDIVLAFDGGNNYNRPNETISLKVDEKIVTLKVDELNSPYGDPIILKVHVTSGSELINEGTIYMALNGNEYSSPVSNGIATFNVGTFEVGNYIGNIAFDGGNNYNNPQSKFMFNVIKRNAIIKSNDVCYIINYDYKYPIVLKDSTGKVIKKEKLLVYLNGEYLGEYTTSSQGKVVVKITSKILKSAKAGTKSLVIEFTNVHYNPTSKTVKVKINKEETKIKAKNKSFASSKKVKKYSVTLKDSKKKAIKKMNVYLKMKGKIYKAVTNSKGKATFKIKKLTQKGTFNAKVKFNGGGRYKASIEKIKIKIK